MIEAVNMAKNKILEAAEVPRVSYKKARKSPAKPPLGWNVSHWNVTPVSSQSI